MDYELRGPTDWPHMTRPQLIEELEIRDQIIARLLRNLNKAIAGKASEIEEWEFNEREEYDKKGKLYPPGHNESTYD